ncbi:hypothetical protein B0H11DRAFT_1918194 [Mycena galericulata]|nr:hypothetical protein B0H11DRAFT_1918194 [Mycena galericulata]
MSPSLTPLSSRFPLEIELRIYCLCISAHPEMRTTLCSLCRRANEWILMHLQENLQLPCNASDEKLLLPAVRLPPELEHSIFTLVASKQPEMHSTLNLVCRRVKEWIEPFEMECLFLATTCLTRHPLICKRRHSKWFSATKLRESLRVRRRVANGIRGLMLGWDTIKDPSLLYPLLPSLEYVVYSMRHRTVQLRFPGFSLSTVLSLPIRRLGFDMHALETLNLFTVEWADKRGSLSSTLTHLELPSASCIGVYLEDLPALSHLCVDLTTHRDVHDFFQILLPRRQFLQHIVERESFLLLVLRILPYIFKFTGDKYSPGSYKYVVEMCSIPVEKIVCLESSIDAALGLCNYFMEVPDMWCEAEAAMGMV